VLLPPPKWVLADRRLIARVSEDASTGQGPMLLLLPRRPMVASVDWLHVNGLKTNPDKSLG
jgi:hypothetical protein